MPLYRGSQRIGAIYKGSTAIARVYKGSTLVFEAGGAPYGEHRYWRLFVENNHGDGTGIVIAEVEFRATAGGPDQVPDLSGYTGVIYSDDASGSEAWRAFDDSSASTWYANSAPTNQYVGYDFGAPIGIAEVAITTAGSGGVLARMPKDCRLEYSDDNSTWTTAFSFSLYNNLFGATYAFPEPEPATGAHKFWRLYITTNGGGTSCELGELEFRGSVGGADLVPTMASNAGGATGRVIGSDIARSGNNGFEAFDDVTSSTSFWWSGSDVATPHWLGFIFPEPEAVAQVAITTRTSPTLNRYPIQCSVEYSDDGTTWTAAASTTLSAWSAGETKTINV